MEHGIYSQCTTSELEQKRTELYAQIDRLRAELVAIGREIEQRMQTGYRPPKVNKNVLLRLLGR